MENVTGFCGVYEQTEARTRPRPGFYPGTQSAVARIEFEHRFVRHFHQHKVMKALLYAQINPQKTMEQLVNDRAIFRYLIVAVLILSACG